LILVQKSKCILVYPCTILISVPALTGGSLYE
jgi:hypothetical protein